MHIALVNISSAFVAISVAPVSQNATLDVNVTFACETTAPPYWIVNGTKNTVHWKSGISFRTMQYGPTDFRSTLYIQATVSNNKTEIQCGVDDIMGDITSSVVVLLIQGQSVISCNLGQIK